MSLATLEQSQEERWSEKKRFWIGVSLGLLFLFSGMNIFVQVVIIPKFQQIYADALPGMPLPGLTQFMISARVEVVFIAVAWTVVGAILLRMQKRYAKLWIYLGMMWAVLHIAINIVALFMPMVGIEDGMSDSTHP